MSQIELGVLRETYIVSPGGVVDLSPQSPVTYIILQGRTASISREGLDQGLIKSQDIATGETFKVRESEVVRLYNHWGRTPVICRALRPLTRI